MRYLLPFFLIPCFLSVHPVRADDPPILKRYLTLEKKSGVKVRRVLGTGELHDGWTRAGAISADGKTAAFIEPVISADLDTFKTRLLIWDVPEGRYRKDMLVRGSVTSLALSRDGSNILLGAAHSDDTRTWFTVGQWDTRTGKRLPKLGTHENEVAVLAFAPQGDKALVAGVHYPKPRVIEKPGACEPMAEEERAPIGQHASIWNLANGTLERKILFPDTTKLLAAAFLPDGKKIVCALDNTLRVIDLTQPDDAKAAKGLFNLAGHQALISDVCVSADGKVAVTASHDSTIRSWDLVKRKPLHVLPKDRFPNSFPSAIGLGDDGKTVVSVWADTMGMGTDVANVRLWNAVTGRGIWSRPASYGGIVPIWMKGEKALIGGGSNILTEWDLAKGVVRRTWGGPRSPVNAVCADSQGRLYSAGQDGRVLIWEKDKIVRTIVAHAEPILALALRPGEKQLLTAGDDKTVKVWDLETGKLRRTLKGHAASINAVVVGRDGTHAYTASADRTVKVWDIETGSVVATLAAYSEVNAIAVSANEAWLASAADDATIRLWPMKRGKLDKSREPITLKGHKKVVTCVAFSPDGKTLVSASQDRTLKIWDWEEGIALRTLRGHTNWITALTLLDTKTALTTSDDLTVRRWDLASGKKIGRVDFGLLGDCPRCLAPAGKDRVVVGTSGWMLFELEMRARKTKDAPGSSK